MEPFKQALWIKPAAGSVDVREKTVVVQLFSYRTHDFVCYIYLSVLHFVFFILCLDIRFPRFIFHIDAMFSQL